MKLSLMFAIVILSAEAAFYEEIYALPAAVWSTTALADQQLAALVMLGPGAVIYLATAIILLWMWLAKMERRESSTATDMHEWNAGRMPSRRR